MRYETRAVLAACYLGPNKSGPGRRMLTHTVEIDDQGEERRVLCDRVSILSIADVHADDPAKAPTCETCARRLAKIQKPGGGA